MKKVDKPITKKPKFLRILLFLVAGYIKLQ
jgi:hypothetical protein